jgi:hypothetical protein
MKIINWLSLICKKIFIRRNIRSYKWRVVELDDNDVLIKFSDGIVDYSLELEWDYGVMDIEFSANGDETFDTTNLHNQYKVITTIGQATGVIMNAMSKKSGYKFHTISFKSSDYRNGVVDKRSMDIRNRFFIRYVIARFPNARVKTFHDDLILINLNR